MVGGCFPRRVHHEDREDVEGEVGDGLDQHHRVQCPQRGEVPDETRSEQAKIPSVNKLQGKKEEIENNFTHLNAFV